MKEEGKYIVPEQKIETIGRIVLYFDLMDSREVEDRNLYKEELYRVIESINSKYREYQFVPMGIIKGIDEVEVILNSYGALLDLMRDFIFGMYKYEYRIVISVGTIDVIGNTVNEMDGAVFHSIGKSMNEIKKKGLYVKFQSNDDLNHALLETNLNMLLSYWYSLTDSQASIYFAIKNKQKQVEYAEANNTTQQYVSKTLKAVNSKLFFWVEEEIQLYLQSL